MDEKETTKTTEKKQFDAKIAVDKMLGSLVGKTNSDATKIFDVGPALNRMLGKE